MVKASAYNAGDPGLIPGLGRSPGGGNGNPLQYSCLEWRSLAGYSPWDCKESHTKKLRSPTPPLPSRWKIRQDSWDRALLPYHQPIRRM